MKPTLFVSAILAFSAPLVHAASDYLLKLEGIKGESSDARYPGTIEVSSFSWGVSNPASTTAGGGGTGKASFQDFHFVCNNDKSSPLLMLACAQGNHIPSATLYVRKPSSDPTGGEAPAEYMEITLTDILVSSFSSNAAPPATPGGPRPLPTESFSLNFSKIEYQVKPADGSAAVKTGWDVKANTKI